MRCGFSGSRTPRPPSADRLMSPTWSFLLERVAPVLGTLAVGAVGWYGTHYIVRPWLEFRELRKLVHESLIFFANVRDRAYDKRYGDAETEFRKLAAKLSALNVSTSPLVARLFSIRGYDLPAAASALIGLSNQLDDTTGERAGLRFDIEKALRLPLTFAARPRVRD